jgi:hypothetical protein
MVASQEDSKHKPLETTAPISVMESAPLLRALSRFLGARGTSVQCDRRYTRKPQTQPAAETVSRQEQKQIQQIDFMDPESKPGKIALEVPVTHPCYVYAFHLLPGKSKESETDLLL